MPGTTQRVRATGKPSPTGSNGRGGDLRLDLGRYVPGLITFVANKLARSATATYQKRFGVNVTEWRILSLLAIEPNIPARRICDVIGFDKGPVSRTLTQMSARGLINIDPDPSSARSHVIALTDEGRAIHDRVIVVALGRERKLLSCLDEVEQATLVQLLGRLHSNLDAIASDGKPCGRARSE